jgi:hypothetical protein
MAHRHLFQWYPLRSGCRELNQEILTLTLELLQSAENPDSESFQRNFLFPFSELQVF